MNQQYYIPASAIYLLSKGVLQEEGSPFSHLVKKCVCFPFFYTAHTALCPQQEENKKASNEVRI